MNAAIAPAPEPAASWRRAWRRVGRWAVAGLIVGVVVWAVLRQAGDVEWTALRPSWPWLAAAAAALLPMYLGIAASERMLLQAFTGDRLPWRDLLPAAWVPMAGKYVPGKVAAAGAAVMLLRRLGVPAAVALGVFVLLDAVPLLTGILLGAALLLEPGVRGELPHAPLLFCVVAGGGVLMMSPPVFRRVTTLGLRVLGRPPLPRVPRWRDYAGPTAFSLVQWVANGTAVWLAIRAFDPGASLATWPWVTCATALAMCVSYFGAFLTPGGIGVREGTLIALLAPAVGVPAATGAAVAMRVLHTAVEALLCGIGLALLRTRPDVP